MELILDTADLDAVKTCDQLFTISGVTTNPSIVASSGKSPEQVADEFCSYLSADQSFFMQVVQTEYEGILEEARFICSLRPRNMYVKIPVTRDGMRAIKAAKAEGLNVLATAIYSANQAFLAALNGADYLAPYVNRMSFYGDGVSEVESLVHMFKEHDLSSKVIAASFKNGNQVQRLLEAGIDAVTLPPSILLSMLDHPGTQIAVDEFSETWISTYGRETFEA